MSDTAIDRREALISIATAALMAAEADAAKSDELIFRPEWRATPRTRNSTSQQRPDWLSFVRNELSRAGLWLQEDQVPPPAEAAPSPAPAPASARAASVPASPAPPPRHSPTSPQPQLQEDAVAELLKRNQDVFDEIINHPFPQALGNATASLDGFRYYMIQDKMYLETCARLKMTAVAASPNFKDVETFDARHKSSMEYVRKLKEILVTMLGLSESSLDAVPRSVELDASENFYKDSLVLRHEDALLGYYVVLLPCVVSYWRIAERLMEDPSTVKNVVYHPAWTEVNYDRSSVDKYTKFINANITAKGGVDRWNYVFRVACQLEAKLFNTGLLAPTPFQIIPDGTYSICIFSLESIVLAIRDVELSFSSFGKLVAKHFLTHDVGFPIIGMKKTGGDNEKWIVTATKDGYTFQNLGTKLYLGISGQEVGRILQAVLEPYYWWINPVTSQPNQGSPLFQIYDSVNLRYTLCAETNIEHLKSTQKLTTVTDVPVIANENSEEYCQMWSFSSCSKSETGRVPQGLENTRNTTVDQVPQEQNEIQPEIDPVKRDKEAASDGHKNQHLLNSVGAKACHWVSFRTSGTFHSASFNEPPIECGILDGLPCFILRQTKQTTVPCLWVCEGARVQNIENFFVGLVLAMVEFEVLVGNMEDLIWVSCCGPFKVESLSHTPVLFKEIDGVATFVARLHRNRGNACPGTVSEGCEALGMGGTETMNVGNYDVLCYKNF